MAVVLKADGTRLHSVNVQSSLITRTHATQHLLSDSTTEQGPKGVIQRMFDSDRATIVADSPPITMISMC